MVKITRRQWETYIYGRMQRQHLKSFARNKNARVEVRKGSRETLDLVDSYLDRTVNEIKQENS